MSAFTAQVDAAFEIEMASCAAIRGLVELYGREPVYMAWRLGYVTGAMQNAQRALESLGGVA